MESERLQRFKQTCGYSENSDQVHVSDSKFRDRIILFLEPLGIDKYDMVDAYYYDYSVIPYHIKIEYQFFRDMYLLFGINGKAEFVTKWVERWDLDSDKPIVNGEVKEKP